MTLPRYPAYKDSGVEWLGEVPEHWEVTRLKLFANIQSSGIDKKSYPEGIEARFLGADVVYSTKEINDDLALPLCSVSAAEWDRLTLKKGDIVVTKDSVVPTRIADVSIISEELSRVVCGYHLVKIRVDGSQNARFFAFSIASESINGYLLSVARGTTIIGLSFKAFADLPLPIPPHSEQQMIATFLDHETSKIDTLIAEQKNLIALLKEKRQAVISNAVTKGLNPDVPMKDSGVEWLGEVPEHWKIGSLKHALEVVADVDHYMPSSVDSGVPYVMTGDLRKLASEIDLGSCKQITREDFLKLTRKIRTSKGDVIMARYATIGSVSYVDIDAEFVVSYSCVTIRPRVESAIGIYLFFYFQSDAFIQGISKMINANTQENVGIGDLKEVKVALPDTNEQKAIVRDLESKLVQLDRIAKDLEAAIRLLVERRSALISAAVTGKIDVRGLVRQEAA